MDEYARICPEKNRHLCGATTRAEKEKFNNGELPKYTNKTANYFKKSGHQKGAIWLCSFLKRHYEFWFSIIALHKLGAVTIPATHLLTKKRRCLPMQQCKKIKNDCLRRRRRCDKTH
ncbi:MAG: hypothetical protein L6V93_19070 [Clostridiales bacterium]|nr:MAG: hypothetical protein L6V93_19070 [Clostridiales bacterium]